MDVDQEKVQGALEKMNNVVAIINETMTQSTPQQAGAMVGDMLTDCQETHAFLESSAEAVITGGQVDLFDLIAETMEEYRKTAEKYQQWVVGDTQSVGAPGPSPVDSVDIDPQVTIDERLMTSSIPGDMFPMSGLQAMGSGDALAEGGSKKKKRDGKKKKDSKEPKESAENSGMDHDFWNSWGGASKTPEEFPASFGAFGDSGVMPRTTSPPSINNAAFPDAFPPAMVEQPLPGMGNVARPSDAVPEDVFRSQQSAPFPDDAFPAPRQGPFSPTGQSSGFKNDRERPSIKSPLTPDYPEPRRGMQPRPADESHRSGWRSPSQRSAEIPKADKIAEEIPGTITVQLSLPRLNYSDIPSSFNNLFARELSDALSISESRIKVVQVRPMAQT